MLRIPTPVKGGSRSLVLHLAPGVWARRSSGPLLLASALHRSMLLHRLCSKVGLDRYPARAQNDRDTTYGTQPFYVGRSHLPINGYAQ